MKMNKVVKEKRQLKIMRKDVVLFFFFFFDRCLADCPITEFPIML